MRFQGVSTAPNINLCRTPESSWAGLTSRLCGAGSIEDGANRSHSILAAWIAVDCTAGLPEILFAKAGGIPKTGVYNPSVSIVESESKGLAPIHHFLS